MNRNFLQIVKDCLTKDFVNFQGRARRKEYWLFLLAFYCIFFLLSFISTLLTTPEIVYIGLILYVPLLAVGVRRMHDTNHSGWYLILPFYNLYLVLKEGDKGSNSYGYDPKSYKDELDELGTH